MIWIQTGELEKVLTALNQLPCTHIFFCLPESLFVECVSIFLWQKLEYQAKKHDPFFFVRQALNPAYWDVAEVLIKEKLILGHNIHPAAEEETKTATFRWNGCAFQAKVCLSKPQLLYEL